MLFKDVIKNLSGFNIKVFDFFKHKELLTCLKESAKQVKQDFKVALNETRVNEVGNKIEPFVKNTLLNNGASSCNTPANTDGKQQSAGYPDLEFSCNGFNAYLECKTFNIQNVDTTQRSFYFSTASKITKNALHFMLSFEIKEKDNFYIVNSYKILSCENLNVDLKAEHNTSNREMYQKEHILFES